MHCVETWCTCNTAQPLAQYCNVKSHGLGRAKLNMLCYCWLRLRVFRRYAMFDVAPCLAAALIYFLATVRCMPPENKGKGKHTNHAMHCHALVCAVVHIVPSPSAAPGGTSKCHMFQWREALPGGTDGAQAMFAPLFRPGHDSALHAMVCRSCAVI